MSDVALPPRNSSFSLEIPGLQIAIDSTSLGEFKKCPRAYQLSVIEGWQTRHTSVHLEFGIWYHGACERYDHYKVAGADHEEALRYALHWLLIQTWNKALNRPWISDHPKKNRLTLIRSVVWYLEEMRDDPMQTVLLASGKPAVEVSFAFDAGRVTRNGEAQLLCGHLDRVVNFNDQLYISDRKTTSSAISPRFFEGFSPGNQFSLYTTAAYVALDIPVRGIIVDAAEIAVTFTRFGRGLVQRDRAQVEEWLEDTHQWLNAMEIAALRGHWPQNDKSCDMYGGCQFRAVCSRSPKSREQWLKSDYVKRVWDPLQRRGDI